MAYVINDTCISCGSCESAAVPAPAFAPRKLSAKNNFSFSKIGKRPFYDGLFSFAPE